MGCSLRDVESLATPYPSACPGSRASSVIRQSPFDSLLQRGLLSRAFELVAVGARPRLPPPDWGASRLHPRCPGSIVGRPSLAALALEGGVLRGQVGTDERGTCEARAGPSANVQCIL